MPAALPIASFLCAALVLVPLPWHWRAGTVPTVSIAFWLFVDNFINGVNTVLWADNLDERALVWCDISTKLFIGSNISLPASIFCLCIHLERVSSVRQVRTTPTQKRRRQIFDCIFCFGLPIIYMALHYVVQGHRFDIVEDFGCRPATYVSLASVFILWVPLLALSAASFVLSTLALHHFWIRRITFARHLASSALTPSRYFRLMALALFQMSWGLAVTLGDMLFTLRAGLRPWVSWADVHSDFGRVGVFPTFVIPARDLAFTYALWWTIPISSFAFFAFFAFGADAVREYKACAHWVLRRPAEDDKAASLPVYNKQHAINLKPLSPASDTPPPQYASDGASSRYASSTKGALTDDASSYRAPSPSPSPSSFRSPSSLSPHSVWRPAAATHPDTPPAFPLPTFYAIPDVPRDAGEDDFAGAVLEAGQAPYDHDYERHDPTEVPHALYGPHDRTASLP